MIVERAIDANQVRLEVDNGGSYPAVAYLDQGEAIMLARALADEARSMDA